MISDSSGTIIYTNQAAACLLRAAPEELPGRPVEEVLDPLSVAARSPEPLGRGLMAWHLSLDALSVLSDVRYAASVGDSLAGTLNLRRTLARIADLAVPTLGTWAGVTLLTYDQMRQCSKGPGTRTEEIATARRRSDDALLAHLRGFEVSALETIEATSADRLQLFGAAEETACELLADGPVTVMLSAMRSRGAIIGLLAVGGRPETLNRRGVEALTRRGALALAAALDYEERSALAATLRASLLPPELPAIPGLSLGAAYRPAQEATEIGGDFYEVRPDGRGWSLSVGDVCGKGIDAAVLNGQVRQSLRTVAHVTDQPDRRLELLNSAMLSTDGRSFVTVLHSTARLVEDGVEMVIAGGGHPPPLWRHVDGTVEEVPVKGPIVGMLEAVEFLPARVMLRPGETMVYYTDGLPDARGPNGLLGDEPLFEVLAACEQVNAQAIAERLMQLALEHLAGRPHDDMAVLAVQPDPR